MIVARSSLSDEDKSIATAMLADYKFPWDKDPACHD